MSNTPQPIQFLLQQLHTNEGDSERFNSINPDIMTYQNRHTNWNVKFCIESNEPVWFEALNKTYQEEILRTCLSRIDIDGDSVLDVFKSYHVQLNCYLAFDYVLRNGNPLDTAIQALHEKMLELVPEYREFITTK